MALPFSFATSNEWVIQFLYVLSSIWYYHHSLILVALIRVWGYHTMVLICIVLMLNDFEHLFVCYVPSVFLFMSLSIFWPDCLYFQCWFLVSALHRQHGHVFCHACDLQILPCLSITLTGSFAEQVWNFDLLKFIIFLFVGHVFSVTYWNFSLSPRPWRFLPTFLLKV